MGQGRNFRLIPNNIGQGNPALICGNHYALIFGTYMRNNFRLHLVFGLALITFFAGWSSTVQAQAQTIGGGLVPIGSAGGLSYPGGMNASSDFRYHGPGGPAANDPVYRRPYPISNGSLGRLGKGLLRGGLGDAALLAALAAVGWAMDSLLNDLYKPASPYAPSPDGVWVVLKRSVIIPYDPNSQAVFAANTASQVCPLLNGTSLGTVTADTLWDGSVICRGTFGSARPTFWPDPTVYPNRSPNTYPQPAPLPVSDDEFGAYLASHPDTHQGLLNNSDGRPYQTAEMVAAQNALSAELNAAYGTSIQPSVAPNPNATPATGTNPLPGTATNPNGTTGNNTNPSPTSLEFPVFCTWASKLCQLADWFREDPPEDPDLDLPEIDLPISTQSYTSSLGAGSCPASPTLNVMGQQVEFSYTPLCTFASYMYYVSIAIAALISAYIISGKKRA